MRFKGFLLFLPLCCYSFICHADNLVNQYKIEPGTQNISIKVAQKYFHENTKALNVQIAQGDNEKIIIKAPEGLMKKVSISNKHGNLLLNIASITPGDAREGNITISITLSSLQNFQSQGNMDITLASLVTEIFTANPSLGTEMKIADINTKKLLITAGTGTNISISNITAVEAELHANMGSEIAIEKESHINKLIAKTSMGSEISASKTQVNTGSLSADFGSSIELEKVNDVKTSTTFGSEIRLLHE